jgi:DNA primase
MIAAGLARPAEEVTSGSVVVTRPMRDFFYDRLMFPIADARGRVNAFGGRGLTADAEPKYINSGENTLFSKGFNLYNFHLARAAAIKAGTIILAEGYMDVIALVRAGFAHAVAPLGTALTDDQLQLLWRTTPEPILAFDGDSAGLKAAHRAAHLALPHLKAGFSLRFAFLPAGEDPDTLIAKSGATGMAKILEAALPLSQMLWRAETEGHDFSTPERRAGLEQRLREIVSQIADGKIADYYRRDFEQKVFESFKARKPQAPAAGRNRAYADRNRPAYATANVSSALKQSLLARAAHAGNAKTAARSLKEAELATLLLGHPALALAHGELVASLPFQEPSLDRLRHELLNLAAAGSSLEKPPVLNHLLRQGMAELLTRLGVRDESPESDETDETEARFLRAAGELREMEQEPARTREFQRLGTEANEAEWLKATEIRRASGE